MIYLLGALVAFQLVLGQVLWKGAVDKYSFALTPSYLGSREFLSFIFSPQVLIGFVIYGVATLSFMALLGKFQYSSVQAVVVSTSLVFAFAASAVIFHERHSAVNVLGFGLLVVGVILATRAS